MRSYAKYGKNINISMHLIAIYIYENV